MTSAPFASGASASQGASCAGPPTGAQQARKPAGGFLDCPVDHLTLPWWLYQQGAMAFGTLRVWLGILELAETRCGAAPEGPAHYRPEELHRLLRAPRPAPVCAVVQQLEALGLLAWSPPAIRFLPHTEILREALTQDGYQRLRALGSDGGPRDRVRERPLLVNEARQWEDCGGPRLLWWRHRIALGSSAGDFSHTSIEALTW